MSHAQDFDYSELFDLLVTPEFITPGQYKDCLSSPLSRLSPEQRLVIFLLRDCIAEYQQGTRHHKISALKWLAQHEHPINAVYFSFPYCCEVLGYEADRVRASMVLACERMRLQKFAVRMTRRNILKSRAVA